MEVLPLLVIAVCMLLLMHAARHVERRRASRLWEALAEVEAASALVIADWPPPHTIALLKCFVAERQRRSASFKQGLHTVSSRDRDYLVLQRIRDAERRLQAARQMASKAVVDTRDSNRSPLENSHRE